MDALYLATPDQRQEMARASRREQLAVLSGESPGRTDDRQTTLFDSTGLAIQDLAIAAAALAALREGRVDAPLARL